MVASLGLSTIQDKLKYFMWLSNTYGKPTEKYMKEFVNTFKGSLRGKVFAEKIKRLTVLFAVEHFRLVQMWKL